MNKQKDPLFNIFSYVHAKFSAFYECVEDSATIFNFTPNLEDAIKDIENEDNHGENMMCSSSSSSSNLTSFKLMTDKEEHDYDLEIKSRHFVKRNYGVSLFYLPIDRNFNVPFFENVSSELIRWAIKKFQYIVYFIKADDLEGKLNIVNLYLTSYPFSRVDKNAMLNEQTMQVLFCQILFRWKFKYEPDQQSKTSIIMKYMFSMIELFESFVLYMRVILWQYRLKDNYCEETFVVCKNFSDVYGYLELMTVDKLKSEPLSNVIVNQFGFLISSTGFTGENTNFMVDDTDDSFSVIPRTIAEDLLFKRCMGFYNLPRTQNGLKVSINENTAFVVADFLKVSDMLKDRSVLLIRGVAIVPLEYLFPRFVAKDDLKFSYFSKLGGNIFKSYYNEIESRLIRYSRRDYKGKERDYDSVHVTYVDPMMYIYKHHRNHLESIETVLFQTCESNNKENIYHLNCKNSSEVLKYMADPSIDFKEVIEKMFHKRFPPCVNSILQEMLLFGKVDFYHRLFLYNFFRESNVEVDKVIDIINFRFKKNYDNREKKDQRVKEIKNYYKKPRNSADEKNVARNCGFCIKNKICPFSSEKKKEDFLKNRIKIEYDLDDAYITSFNCIQNSNPFSLCAHLSSVVKGGNISKGLINPVGFFLHTPDSSKKYLEVMKSNNDQRSKTFSPEVKTPESIFKSDQGQYAKTRVGLGENGDNGSRVNSNLEF